MRAGLLWGLWASRDPSWATHSCPLAVSEAGAPGASLPTRGCRLLPRPRWPPLCVSVSGTPVTPDQAPPPPFTLITARSPHPQIRLHPELGGWGFCTGMWGRSEPMTGAVT